MRQLGGRLLVLLVLSQNAAWPAQGSAAGRACRRLSREGARLIAGSRYAEAEKAFAGAIETVRDEGPSAPLCKLLSNLGSARLYQQNYSGALVAFLQARETAHSLGLREVEAGIWSNIAALYGLLCAWPAAETAARQAASLVPPNSRFRPAIQAQQVRIAFRRQDRANPLQLWAAALDQAQAAADRQTERILWEELGAFRMSRGELAPAEDAYANALRLTRLHRLPGAEPLFLAIASLRRAQHQPREALGWIARARAAADHRNPVNPLRAAMEEAAALQELAGARAGLQAYRRAWRSALEWRGDILPDLRAEASADAALAQLAASYAALVLEAGRPAPAALRESWAVIEQSRAQGLLRRTMRRASVLQKLGPAYAAALARHRQALLEGSVLAAASGARLAELETMAGLGARDEIHLSTAPPDLFLRGVQERLGRARLLLTLQGGTHRSYVWAVTGSSIHLAVLPGRRGLEPLLASFRENTRANRPQAARQGEALYRLLFGTLPAAALAREEWLISAGDLLWGVPLAALVERHGRRAGYLAEFHTLAWVPSALWLLHGAPARPPERFLAVGDAIHNAADARLLALRPQPAPLSFWFIPARQPHPPRLDTVELPSLPGSRAEIETIERLWRQTGRAASLLGGFDASLPRVQQALGQPYSDIHFATHVLPAPERPASYYLRLEAPTSLAPPPIVLAPAGETFLALSINRSGQREGLDPYVLSRLHLPGSRIVLNGCSSAADAGLAAAGLLDFTTAWLAAGAGSVVASLWPVDDDGAFFSSYYNEILKGAPPAAAVRAAQSAMIRGASWRSQPRYWAAYIPIGKD